MSSCTVDRCCCCIDLKTGCYIIGYLSLIGNVFLLGYTVLPLLALTWHVARTGVDKDANIVIDAAIVMLILIFIACLCNVIFDVILLVGLRQNKPSYLKAFLVFSVISLLSMIIFRGLSAGESKKAAPIIIQITCEAILGVYLLVVIRSYLLQMSNQPSRVIQIPVDPSASVQPINADTPAFNPAPPFYNPTLHQANNNFGNPPFNPAPPHY